MSTFHSLQPSLFNIESNVAAYHYRHLDRLPLKNKNILSSTRESRGSERATQEYKDWTPRIHMAQRTRLFELPAELRIKIYESALAPTGSIILAPTRAKRYATTPVISPALLAVSRHINNEASSILYEQNTFCISVNAKDTVWPVIAEGRLPQRALGKLEHFCVVLDCCTRWFRAEYSDVDWAAFTALTSLKTLRIAVLDHDSLAVGLDNDPGQVQSLLTEILHRIPATTKVSYGTLDGSPEQHFAHTILEKHNKNGEASGEFVELHGNILSQCEASMSDLDRGCKSGGIPDVFAEYRHMYQRTGSSRVADL